MSEKVKELVSISVWMLFTVMKTEANMRYLRCVSWGSRISGESAYAIMKAQKMTIDMYA